MRWALSGPTLRSGLWEGRDMTLDRPGLGMEGMNGLLGQGTSPSGGVAYA